MKCEEEGMDCPNEAVGTDIQGWHLCRRHLDFSMFVQRLCNRYLEEEGLGALIPEEFRTDSN